MALTSICFALVNALLFGSFAVIAVTVTCVSTVFLLALGLFLLRRVVCVVATLHGGRKGETLRHVALYRRKAGTLLEDKEVATNLDKLATATTEKLAEMKRKF